MSQTSPSTHTVFLRNNIDKLIQIYITETQRCNNQRGILLLDFRNQDKNSNVDVSYVGLANVPGDIRNIVIKKMEKTLYDSVAFFCILKPDNQCLLFDINLDKNRDSYFMDNPELP